MPLPPKEPESRASDVAFKILMAALALSAVAGLLLMSARIKRCQGVVDDFVDGMDALRTDAKWLDVYRDQRPVDAEVLARKGAAVGTHVVVRGLLHSLDVSDPDRPTMDLFGNVRIVRCRFDAWQVPHLRKLKPAEYVVFGGTVAGQSAAVLELKDCHREVEWTRK